MAAKYTEILTGICVKATACAWLGAKLHVLDMKSEKPTRYPTARLTAFVVSAR